MLRLKMTVAAVKSSADQEGKKASEELTLHAVYSSNPNSANAQWSKWTPSAQLTMTITNPAAFDRVRPGQFVFVDLTPAGKDD
jgi:hypothetical protein